MSEPVMEERISQEGHQVGGIACVYIKRHRRIGGFLGALRRVYLEGSGDEAGEGWPGWG